VIILLTYFFLSIIATFFIAILFRVPKKGLLPTSLIGGSGYAIFLALSPGTSNQMVAYFFATFFITICSEVFARIMKMPATIFTVPGIIPLVPGIGLYNTMMHLVQNSGNISQTATDTLLAVVAMAMAMVLTSLLTKNINNLITSLFTKLKIKGK